ncbi:hypothetical protein [Delftia deserti]|uniref:Uncharacterized protein n=1 Tax=Delftia deserti TaxID=1651218 RepID=A0ABW5EZV2_9BURK
MRSIRMMAAAVAGAAIHSLAQAAPVVVIPVRPVIVIPPARPAPMAPRPTPTAPKPAKATPIPVVVPHVAAPTCSNERRERKEC